jgi:large subunit ribosomal protein L25
MERVEIQAQSRTVQGKQVKKLRAQDLVPAVVYGPDTPPKPIQIQWRSLFRILQQSGSTSLINLLVEGEPNPYVVLPREIQLDALTGRLQHVDFYQVRLTEKVRTMPRLVFVGESPLVQLGDAVLIHSMTEVQVECLPTDLINSIEVDVSGLEALGDNVVVGDLPVPPEVTIMADPDDVVVSVVTTRAAISDEAEAEFADEEAEAEEDVAAED